MTDILTPANPGAPDIASDRLDATAATAPTLDTQQVRATAAALALIERVTAQHGPVMFHQSGGCCDGSAPMCYPAGDLLVGDQDRLLGDIGGMPFYISASQFEYWKGTQLIIDVVPGRGGMFSLEGPLGLRFLTRSRIWTDAEWQALLAVGRVTP